MILRLGGKTRFEVIPPGELRAGTIQLDEKESDANARPEHHQVTPSVISQQLKGVNGRKN